MIKMDERRKYFFMIICLLQIIAFSGCSMFSSERPSDFEIGQKKIRDQYGDPPAKGYQPLDPLQVKVEVKDSGEKVKIENYNKALLNSLPNEAVRLAIGQADRAGNISFGPFTAMAKAGSYVVVLDYIKYDSKFISLIVTDEIPSSFSSLLPPPPLTTDFNVLDAFSVENYKSRTEYMNQVDSYFSKLPYWARDYNMSTKKNNEELNKYEKLYNVPVYEGIGVRMVASITVSDTSVDIGSLYGLAAAAQNKQLKGSLIIQTLGMSGENISPLIPLPSEINVTTIQNAIQALATIKSKMYDPNIYLVPVVLAIDDYIGRPGAKEQILSTLRENGDNLVLYISPVPK